LTVAVPHMTAAIPVVPVAIPHLHPPRSLTACYSGADGCKPHMSPADRRRFAPATVTNSA
jgi:hypothetical protein